MKKIFGLLFLVFFQLQAAEELNILQVQNDIFDKIDFMGVANGKTLNLRADNEAMRTLNREIAAYSAAILEKLANAQIENPQIKALQFKLLNSNKELVSVRKIRPLEIVFELHIAGYVRSLTERVTLNIENDKFVINGIQVPVSSKFIKVSDKSRSKDFKDTFTSDQNIGKTPGKVQSI